MTLAIYVLGVVLFAAAFGATGLASSFGRVVETSRGAAKVALDKARTDDEKEIAARRAGLDLLRQSAMIFIKGGATVLAAAMPFWIADVAAIRPLEETMAFALRWDVLGITTLVMIGLVYVWRRLRAA